MNHRVSLKLVGAIMAPAVLVAFLVGLMLAGVLDLRPAGAQPNAALAQTGQGLTAADHSPFVQVADAVLPAVVNISAEKTVKISQRQQSPLQGSPFEEFFRDFTRGLPDIPQERQQNALGSGVVISPDGYIVTNNHVVAGFDKIAVRLSDETEFKGSDVKVVGRDPKSDLAVLKVQSKKPLAAVTLANPDDIKVGDWAIAVGNPFGLTGTVTVGVVSAKGRSGLPLPEGPSYQDFIQTDASINPGNSGGALVNIKGELMGINSAIRTPTGGSVGIGFAVPVDIVKSVTDQLIKTGKVVRGYMGIRPQPVTDAIRQAMGLDDSKGVLVADVVAGQPADKAGIKSGDVIVAVNGEKTDGVEQFRRQVADFAPGSSVSIGIVRDGERTTKRMTLVTFPEDEQQASTPPEEPATAWLGITVRSLTGGERTEAKVSGGVLVEDVEAGSAAAGAGIERGDIVLEVGKVRIGAVNDYNRAVRQFKSSNKAVLFRINRAGSVLYIAVAPGE
ncbi:MAG: Do family serine endopeptidase [candidate division WOR-3 bacterium]|nr:Do family serine endopeptidase [candidate division WOR-3 bacterium]